MASRPKKKMAKARLRWPDPDPAVQEKRRLTRAVQHQRDIRRLVRALAAARAAANLELLQLARWMRERNGEDVPADESLEAVHA